MTVVVWEELDSYSRAVEATVAAAASRAGGGAGGRRPAVYDMYDMGSSRGGRGGSKGVFRRWWMRSGEFGLLGGGLLGGAYGGTLYYCTAWRCDPAVFRDAVQADGTVGTAAAAERRRRVSGMQQHSADGDGGSEPEDPEDGLTGEGSEVLEGSLAGGGSRKGVSWWLGAGHRWLDEQVLDPLLRLLAAAVAPAAAAVADGFAGAAEAAEAVWALGWPLLLPHLALLRVTWPELWAGTAGGMAAGVSVTDGVAAEAAEAAVAVAGGGWPVGWRHCDLLVFFAAGAFKPTDHLLTPTTAATHTRNPRQGFFVLVSPPYVAFPSHTINLAAP